jgi:nitroreductase
MDVYRAIRTILAVRSYKDQPIPREVVDRIVEAARITASSRNGQPWHFVVVENRETLKKLGTLVRTGPYTAGAALAVAVAYNKDDIFGVSDASRAIQNMMLAAWNEGIGSNWVGFHGLEAVAKELGIPDTMDLIALVPFGYPAEARTLGRKNRKALGEVVSRERFGEPYS